MGPASCGVSMEDVNHILRFCSSTLQFWLELILPDKLQRFMELDIPSWVVLNLSSVNHGVDDTSHWGLLFAAIVWNIWLARNAKIFCTDDVGEELVIGRSRHLLQLTLNSQDTGGSSRIGHSNLSLVMLWSPPPGLFIKVNIDATHHPSDGFARCGVVTRDFLGSWKFSFAKSLGVCSVVDVELWGVYIGLSLAWNVRFRNVIIEMDSQESLQIIQGGN
ncbi:hypothetical protein GQ457_09G018440 [Hibiscus cannabinus]